MTTKQQAASAGKEFPTTKPVIALMAAGLIIMFMTSFLGGGAVPEERSRRNAQAQEEGALAEVPQLMAKLQSNPNDTNALKELAEAFSRAKDWEKAALFWSKVVDILPEDINALNHRGAALMRVNRYHEAAADYEKVLQINPQAYHALYYLGVINKYGLQNKEKAQSYFQQALDMNPKEPEFVKAIKEEMGS